MLALVQNGVLKEKPMDSKMQKALALVKGGENPYAAAKAAGLSSASGLYRKLKIERDKEAGLCPHCGQPMPKAKKGK